MAADFITGSTRMQWINWPKNHLRKYFIPNTYSKYVISSKTTQIKKKTEAFLCTIHNKPTRNKNEKKIPTNQKPLIYFTQINCVKHLNIVGVIFAANKNKHFFSRLKIKSNCHLVGNNKSIVLVWDGVPKNRINKREQNQNTKIIRFERETAELIIARIANC